MPTLRQLDTLVAHFNAPYGCSCATDAKMNPVAIPMILCGYCTTGCSDLPERHGRKEAADAIEAEFQRLYTTLEAIEAGLTFPDKYEDGSKRLWELEVLWRRAATAGPDAIHPEYNFGWRGNKSMTLHYIVLLRWKCQSMQIPWAASLREIAPLSWHEHLEKLAEEKHRQEHWYTVRQLTNIPVLTPREEHVVTETIAEALCGLDYQDHRNLRVTRNDRNIKLRETMAIAMQSRLRLVKSVGLGKRPLQIGWLVDDDGETPILAFAIYGKHWGYAKTGVVNRKGLQRFARQCAMNIGCSSLAGVRILRNDWPPSAEDPSVGLNVHMDEPFVSKDLLDPEEDGNTANWVIKAVQAANAPAIPPST